MKTVKKRSQLQEKSVAKSFGARPTAASGALWGMKGDVRNDKFLIECKTTEKDYYTVTTKVWEKIQSEAIKDHDRTPLLVVDLCDTDRYVIFDPCYFERGFSENVIAGGSVCKSFKLKECKEHKYMPILFCLEAEKANKRRHTLMAWGVNEFTDYFKEELV